RRGESEQRPHALSALLVTSEVAYRAVQPRPKCRQFPWRAVRLPESHKRLLHDVFRERRISGDGHGEVVGGPADGVNQRLEPGSSRRLHCHTSVPLVQMRPTSAERLHDDRCAPITKWGAERYPTPGGACQGRPQLLTALGCALSEWRQIGWQPLADSNG